MVRERRLVRRTPKSLTDKTALRRERATIGAQRFSVDDEEFALGARSIAAGVMYRDRVVAALSLSGTTDHITAPTVRS